MSAVLNPVIVSSWISMGHGMETSDFKASFPTPTTPIPSTYMILIGILLILTSPKVKFLFTCFAKLSSYC